MAPRQKQKHRPSCRGSAQGAGTSEVAAAVLQNAATNDTLIPMLTLDQLRDSLWQHLGPEDRKSMRLLSKAMRHQASECVRSLEVLMPNPMHGARPLQAFPRLKRLTFQGDLDDKPGAITGEDIALMLQTDAATSNKLRHLTVRWLRKHLWQTMRALPCSPAWIGPCSMSRECPEAVAA